MIDPGELERHRQRLWGLCYRITGVAADADDLVQETFVRALESPPHDLSRELLPWLVRVATNASRDALRRRKTQGYVGVFLPSPVDDERLAADPLAAPDARYGNMESLSYAFLIALEALSPTQRAVLILRDVLGYSVRETAEVLALSEPNVKTTHHRARHALTGYEDERPRRVLAPEAQARGAMGKLMMLVQTGDARRVEQLLAADVTAVNDGGGEFLAALRPVVSRDHVARFLVGVARNKQLLSAATYVANGLPALLVRIESPEPRVASRSINLFDVRASGEIASIYSVVATRKLAHLD